MEKTEVYSWRLDPQVKSALESAARAEGTSLSRLLDRITTEWLGRELDSREGEEAQKAIRKRAMRYVGSIHGTDPRRAGEASRRLREILARKHGRLRAG
jgi:hypothetical protein